VIRRKTKGGVVWALRFRAYGTRQYHTLGAEADGWTRRKAEMELQNVLADVRRGIWTPPTRGAGQVAKEKADAEPTFHRFSSDWIAGRRGEISDSGLEYYAWALSHHLLPYFADWKLSEIDVESVDAYRRFKVLQSEERRAALAKGRPKLPRTESPARPLSAATINKTIDVLQAVLSLAVEYGHIDRNPASGRRRRLKLPPRATAYLDRVDQIEAVLDAAHLLDTRQHAQTTGRRPLVAVLILAGLRASEACGLRWRDIDLANGRLQVGRSKTQAGLREVTLLPLLRDDLLAHKATTGDVSPDDPVFTSASGKARDKDNLRSRVLDPVLVEADRLLMARGHAPLTGRITPHKLRHTFASILVACGEDPASVMAQLGHTDPKFTLRTYTHLMRREPAERERLKALVYGADPGGSPDDDPARAGLARLCADTGLPATSSNQSQEPSNERRVDAPSQ
jgi:integrase